MGQDSGKHVVGTGELGEEAFRFRSALVDRQCGDAGRIEEDTAGRDPHAYRPRGRHRLERIPEHVHNGGDAREQQFGEADNAAQSRCLRIEDRAFRLPHGLEPGFERQVLDQAAKQAVAGMAMGVDDAGHQDVPCGVEDLARILRAAFEFGGGRNVGQAAVRHGDAAVAKHDCLACCMGHGKSQAGAAKHEH